MDGSDSFHGDASSSLSVLQFDSSALISEKRRSARPRNFLSAGIAQQHENFQMSNRSPTCTQRRPLHIHQHGSNAPFIKPARSLSLNEFSSPSSSSFPSSFTANVDLRGHHEYCGRRPESRTCEIDRKRAVQMVKSVASQVLCLYVFPFLFFFDLSATDQPTDCRLAGPFGREPRQLQGHRRLRLHIHRDTQTGHTSGRSGLLFFFLSFMCIILLILGGNE